jgi:hypothetical protein
MAIVKPRQTIAMQGPGRGRETARRRAGKKSRKAEVISRSASTPEVQEVRPITRHPATL